MKRFYNNVPVWMRPTDWEVLPSGITKTYETWSNEEVDRMLKLHAAGIELKEIAVILGRGYTSVKCKHRKVVRGRE